MGFTAAPTIEIDIPEPQPMRWPEPEREPVPVAEPERTPELVPA